MTSLRSRLFHGTAVAALALLPDVSRAAPALPNLGVITSGTVTASGSNVTVSGGGTFGTATPITVTNPGNSGTLNLVVGPTGGAAHQSAIITWNSFDIGSTTAGTVVTNNVVNFSGAGGGAYSVLNRVTGGSLTTIAGSIDGGGNGSIFLINEAGISFKGSSTVMNLSSFVASSLDIDDTKFNLLATGSPSAIEFSPNLGTANNGITIDAGATIAPGSVLLLVAPSQTIGAATLSATGGDAGFVVASDATVTLSPTSLISIKIAKGTDFATNGGSVIGASVLGKRVLLAAASTADITSTLLNVTGNLTSSATATASDHGIVIAIGHDAPIDANNSANTISFTAPTDPVTPTDGAQFRADLTVSGALQSSGRVDTISTGRTTVGAVTAMGGVSLLAGTGSVGGMALTTGGDLTLGDNVSAGGDLTASGTSIVLGGGTLSATGNIGLTATGTSITATAPTTLTANPAGTTPSTITLSAAGDIGDVTNPGYISITGATINPALIVNGGTASTMYLGAVTGASLTSTTGAPLSIAGATTIPGTTMVANDLTIGTTADVATGAVTAGGNIAISGATVGTGFLGAQGAVTATASGALTVAGATSGSAGGAGHDIALTANGGRLTVTGDVTSTGALTGTGTDVLLGTAGETHTLSAAGAVTLQSTTGDMTANGTLTIASAQDGLGAGDLILDTAAAVTGAPNLIAGTAAAGMTPAALTSVGIVSHDHTQAITVGDVTGLRFGSASGTPGAYTFTNALATTIGNITTGNIDVTQDITLSSGLLLTGGNIVAGVVTSTAGSVNVTASGLGNTVKLTGASATGAAFDTVALSADGALMVTGDLHGGGSISANSTSGLATVAGFVTAGTDYTVTGATVSLGAAGTTQQAGGNILVRSAGTLAAAGTLTVDNGDAGGKKLVLDAGTTITGGAALTSGTMSLSDVLVLAGGDVTLGDVTANRFTGATKALIPAGNVGDYTATGSFTTAGAVSLGSVTTASSNAIVSTGPMGDGDVTTVKDTSTAGGVTLTSTNGTLTAGDVSAFAGDASLSGGSGILTSAGAHAIAASGNVLLASDGGVTVDAVRAGGTVTVEGITTPAAGAASLTANSIEANGDIAITTVGSLDVSGGDVTIETKPLLADLSGFDPAGMTIATPASLSLTSTAGLVKAAALSATGNISVNAFHEATVAGTVTAGGNYLVIGSDVTLGTDATTTQTAGGNVLVRSLGDTHINGSLNADTGGTGTLALVIDAAGSIDGSGNLTSGTTAAPSTIGLHVGSGQTVTLGDITADSLVSVTSAGMPLSVAGYTVTAANTLSAGGALSFGAVNTVQSNVLQTPSTVMLTSDTSTAGSVMIAGDAGVTTTGALTAASMAGSVTVASANGDVVVGGAVSSGTFAYLHSDAGALMVGDVSSHAGDAALHGKTLIDAGTHTIAATGNAVLASDGGITVGNIRGGTIDIGGFSGINAGSLTGNSLRAAGPVTVHTGGDISLAGIGAPSAESTGMGLDPLTLASFNNGTVGAGRRDAALGRGHCHSQRRVVDAQHRHDRRGLQSRFYRAIA